MSHFKQYLGDSVYADFDGYNIILTTEDGINVHDRICVEPQVLGALNRYDQWVKKTLLLNKLKNEPTRPEAD
jgi:hypothetical protein